MAKKTKVKKVRSKKVNPKSLQQLIDALEENLKEDKGKWKKPVVTEQPQRSFKGYPEGAVRHPQDMLKATLEHSQGTVNACLNQTSNKIMGMAKQFMGREKDPTDGILNFLAELKSFVKTSNKNAGEAAAWSTNYAAEYNKLLKKMKSIRESEKTDLEVVNSIVEFIEKARVL